MARLLALLALFPLTNGTTARADNRDLETFINSYYLASDKLADFDAELDLAVKQNNPGLLLRSPSYKELLALRMIQDGHGHALTDDRAFLGTIDALGPVERLALDSLRDELPEGTLPVFYATPEQEKAARLAAEALIQERVKIAKADKSLAAELKDALASLDFDRAPPARSTQIHPSAGPEGTISGDQFPLNTWALTYDDGPHAKYTPMVFANLAAAHKHASFMWLVQCLMENNHMPDLAHAAGMSTNDHSWTHANLAKAATASLTKEITQSSQKDSQFYGARPRFFRLPYGAGLNSKPARTLIAQNGMIHVFWNVDSLDWQDKEPTSILARVKKQMLLEKKGIILFHDIHPQSVEGSKLVLDWSATLDGTHDAQRWVTIPEIVDELNSGH